jgi:hypothetical protein
MSQINGIVLSIREEQADEFEALFKAEEYPTWLRIADAGELIYASLTRVAFGTHQKEGVRHYLVVAEFRTMKGHTMHDDDPGFNAYNEKADRFQPAEPFVFGGFSVARYPAEEA